MFSGNQRKGILLLISLLIVAGLVFHLYERLTPPPKGIVVKSEGGLKEESKPKTSPSIVYVQVCGAVKNPGVYQVQRGTRLFEVVKLAGGLSPDADAQGVNLAKVVEDGEKVFIPRVGESKKESEPSGSSVTKPNSPSRGSSKLINVNKATVEELKDLPGIGRTIAQRIVEYREKNGPFKEPADLLKVKGIGEKKLEKIRSMITF